MWSRTRNNADVPAPGTTAPAEPQVPRLVIGVDEMRRLLADGQARPLSRIVTSFVRYDRRWWLDASGEWLAITDPDYVAKLNRWAVAGQLDTLG
jgi:hypothetical protein